MIDFKSIKDSWKFQVYRISSKTTPYVYIGIVTSFGKSYVSRFIEHMTNNGSTSFRNVFGKNFDPNDFYTDLIDCCDTKEQCLKLESYYIRCCNPLHCLNMLVGRNTNMYASIVDFYENEVLDNGYCPNIHLYTTKNISSQLGDFIFKNVHKGTDDDNAIKKHYIGKSSFKQTDAWKAAKKSRGERRARKEHTEREADAYRRRKTETKNDWNSLTKEEYEKKSSGLRMMNNPAVCPNCNKTLTVGIIRREIHTTGKCKDAIQKSEICSESVSLEFD